MPNDNKHYKTCPTCGGTGKNKKRLLLSGPIVIIIGFLCVFVLKLETSMNLVVFFTASIAFTLFTKCSTCKGNKRISIDTGRKK